MDRAVSLARHKYRLAHADVPPHRRNSSDSSNSADSGSYMKSLSVMTFLANSILQMITKVKENIAVLDLGT